MVHGRWSCACHRGNGACSCARGGALSDAGLIVEERRPPHVERGNEMWLKLFSRASVVQLRKFIQVAKRRGRFVCKLAARALPTTTAAELWTNTSPTGWNAIGFVKNCSLDGNDADHRRASRRHTCISTRHAESHGSRFHMGTFRAFSYAQTFNVFDLPVVTVPAGKSNDGLPIGVQIVGRRLRRRWSWQPRKRSSIEDAAIICDSCE